MTPEQELQLVAAVIQYGDIITPKKLGILPEFLGHVPAQMALAAIYKYSDHGATQGKVPGIAYLHAHGIQYQSLYNPASGDLMSLCQAAKTNQVRKLVLKATQEIMLTANHDPVEAYNRAQQLFYSKELVSLTTTGHGSGFATGYRSAVENYKATALTGGIVGLPTPFQTLTNNIKGWQKGGFYVIYAPPKSYKCVVEGSELLQQDGTYLKIDGLSAHCTVPSHTSLTGRNRWARSELVHSGTKECVRVTTQSGRQLETSHEHLYMRPGGAYSKLQDLSVGDYVVLASALPECAETLEISPQDAHMIGLLTGDGGLTTRVTFSSADADILFTLRNHAMRWNCQVTHMVDYNYAVVGEFRGHNPILNYMRTLGLFGHKSTAKQVPIEIYRSGKEAIAAYLAGLLDTDGAVQAGNDRKSKGVIAWSTSSPHLAHQIPQLLLRLGITAKKYPVSDVAWGISVADRQSLQKLANHLGPYISCGRKLQMLMDILATTPQRNVFKDVIPVYPGLRELVAKAGEGRMWPTHNGRRMCMGDLFKSDRDTVSRQSLAMLAKAWGSFELNRVVDAELRYEKITQLEEIGARDCWDICIADGQDPNFIVNDFVVHNSFVALACLTVLYAAGYRVLCISTEMTHAQMNERVLCMLQGVDFNGWIDRTLPAHVISDLEDDISAFEARAHMDLLHWTPSSMGDQAIAEVRGKIQENNHDGNLALVLWDGHYRSAESDEWKDIYHLTRRTRALALDPSTGQVPILITTSEGSKKGEVAYKALEQEADVLMHLRKMSPGKAELSTRAIRQGRGCKCYLDMNFKNTSIIETASVQEDEAEEAQAGGGGLF